MDEPDASSQQGSPSGRAAAPRAEAADLEHPPPLVSPDLHRALLESMTEGVSLSREDGIIVYTNPAEDRIFGYAPGELIGRHVSVQNAYPADENARIVAEVIEELKRSGAWRGDWLNRRKDGSLFVTTSRITAVDIDGGKHWLCVQEDVTTERAAADTLRESEARLDLAAAAAQIGIWDWDLMTNRMTYSPLAKAISGFAPDREVSFEDVRDIVHPEDHPFTAAQARRALDPAIRDESPFEYRILRPDGSVRWVVAHGRAVFGERDGAIRALRYVGTLQDITERRRLEAAELDAAQRLRLAIDAGRMAVWAVDLRSETVVGSPELNRLLGFPENAEPTLEEMRARYYPGERERLQAIGRDVLASGERFMEAEYRSFWPDGSIRWLLLRCEFQLDAEGTPIRAVGVLTDVTERKRTEERLRASEARLGLAQRAAGAGVWDWDVASGELVWSPEIYEFYGVDPSTPDLYGAWLRAVHPDDRARADQTARRAAEAGESFSMDFRVVAPDGGERWIRSQATVVLGLDGKPWRVAGINIDVTDQHREEERLRAQAESLESAVEERTRERDRIYELSNDLFAVAGFDGRLKTINPAWTRLLGRSEAELLARPFIEIIHPDDHAAAAEVVAALQAGVQTRRFEDRLLRADGSVVWIAWAAVPEDELFYAVGRDITEQKEREAELEAAQEALRQSQKMESMGQLTGGVAHDFNNLLTPIVGTLDMLQRRGLGGERERRLIEGAAQSADRAKTLVQRLLAFARRQPLQTTAVDVGKLVKGMADLVASTTGPQIRLVVEAVDDLPPAKADPHQLEMALLNLSVNARDAMPEGGTLTISATAETVHPGSAVQLKPGGYVRLTVADTGVGMDEQTRARAVEPFFSTKGVGKGTGLGLSMAHGLALQLGGALTINSQSGLGAKVELWLPQSDATPKVAASSCQPWLEPSLGVALLVDDEQVVRVSIADMLCDLGYRVIEAASAEEALAIVRKGAKFDLVLTDHLMPGMTGTDLARALKGIDPHVPVLIVSGYAESSGVEPDLPRLTKPFRKDQLAASLLALPTSARRA